MEICSCYITYSHLIVRNECGICVQMSLCEKMKDTHEGHARQLAIALPHSTHNEWLQLHSELAQLTERSTHLEKLSTAPQRASIYFVCIVVNGFFVASKISLICFLYLLL